MLSHLEVTGGQQVARPPPNKSGLHGLRESPENARKRRNNLASRVSGRKGGGAEWVSDSCSASSTPDNRLSFVSKKPSRLLPSWPVRGLTLQHMPCWRLLCNRIDSQLKHRQLDNTRIRLHNHEMNNCQCAEAPPPRNKPEQSQTK